MPRYEVAHMLGAWDDESGPADLMCRELNLEIAIKGCAADLDAVRKLVDAKVSLLLQEKFTIMIMPRSRKHASYY